MYVGMHEHIPSHFSCDLFFVTPCTVAHQVPLSMGFSRQDCWSGLPFLVQYVCIRMYTHTHIL